MSRFMGFIDSVPDLIAMGFLLFGMGCLALSEWRGGNGHNNNAA